MLDPIFSQKVLIRGFRRLYSVSNCLMKTAVFFFPLLTTTPSSFIIPAPLLGSPLPVPTALTSPTQLPVLGLLSRPRASPRLSSGCCKALIKCPSFHISETRFPFCISLNISLNLNILCFSIRILDLSLIHSLCCVYFNSVEQVYN